MPAAITTFMPGYGWLSNFVTVAILAGFSSVILVMLLGQSRVFYSMSRDGLVPPVFSEVHPTFQDAAQVELAVLRLHVAVRGVHSRRRRRRDDEHRHAVRVHPRLHRRLDHARASAGHPARIHGAGAAARRDSRRGDLRRDDLWPGLDELAAARRLARDRPGDLLRLQHEAQQARRSRALRARFGRDSVAADCRRLDGVATAAAIRAELRRAVVAFSQRGGPPAGAPHRAGRRRPGVAGLRPQQGKGRRRHGPDGHGAPAAGVVTRDDLLGSSAGSTPIDLRRHPRPVAAAAGAGQGRSTQQVFDAIDPAQGRRRLPSAERRASRAGPADARALHAVGHHRAARSRSGIAIAGRRAVVIGRSEIVGKPMALLLLAARRHGDDLSLADDGSRARWRADGRHPGRRDRPARVRHARLRQARRDRGRRRHDAVTDRATGVEAVWRAQPRLADFDAKGTTVVGDVHPAVADVAGALSPVPGGVGPLTIAMLLKNTLNAAAAARHALSAVQHLAQRPSASVSANVARGVDDVVGAAASSRRCGH